MLSVILNYVEYKVSYSHNFKPRHRVLKVWYKQQTNKFIHNIVTLEMRFLFNVVMFYNKSVSSIYNTEKKKIQRGVAKHLKLCFYRA